MRPTGISVSGVREWTKSATLRRLVACLFGGFVLALMVGNQEGSQNDFGISFREATSPLRLLTFLAIGAAVFSVLSLWPRIAPYAPSSGRGDDLDRVRPGLRRHDAHPLVRPGREVWSGRHCRQQIPRSARTGIGLLRLAGLGVAVALPGNSEPWRWRRGGPCSDTSRSAWRSPPQSWPSWRTPNWSTSPGASITRSASIWPCWAIWPTPPVG